MEHNAIGANMDSSAMPVDQSLFDTARTVVCPNCGHRQRASAGQTECAWCGQSFTVNAKESFGDPYVDQADPTEVPPPSASGGLGRPTEGNQVPLRPSSSVPGKPMAPIADEPVGSDLGSIEPGSAQVSESEKSRIPRES
jgi:DNA-directed RNA polymerase subunit RPC12/RpoP